MTVVAPTRPPAADTPTAPQLQRLTVGLADLARFARRQGLDRAIDRDLGYALHALLAAGLGDLAPKPFAVDPGPVGGGAGPAAGPSPEATAAGRLTLLGYGAADAAALAARLAERQGDRDESRRLAAAALSPAPPAAKPMPAAIPAGRLLAFRLRACPVVRSRTLARAHGHGKSREVDAYEHRRLTDPSGFDAAGAPPPPDATARIAAYLDWLEAQITRDGAATPVDARVVGLLRRPLWRRGLTHTESRRGRKGGRGNGDGDADGRPAADPPERVLRTTGVPVPDAVFEGVLRVDDPAAFAALLARGVGRHRAFGFGMLLLAPAG
ncbi:MAG: type I-E CRISPR-associated protein Cas6/Cse3/CasE [Azospirillaceae bacterium]